jgi:hypothetical protein
MSVTGSCSGGGNPASDDGTTRFGSVALTGRMILIAVKPNKPPNVEKINRAGMDGKQLIVE